MFLTLVSAKKENFTKRELANVELVRELYQKLGIPRYMKYFRTLKKTHTQLSNKHWWFQKGTTYFQPQGGKASVGDNKVESDDYKGVDTYTDTKNNNGIPSKCESIGRLFVCTINPSPTQHGKKIPVQNHKNGENR